LGLKGGTKGPPRKKESIMRGWMNYAGAGVLILAGILLYSVDADFPTAGTPILALPMIFVGLVWGGLALRKQLTSSHSGDDTHRRVG
jgi:hypothetical protein